MSYTCICLCTYMYKHIYVHDHTCMHTHIIFPKCYNFINILYLPIFSLIDKNSINCQVKGKQRILFESNQGLKPRKQILGKLWALFSLLEVEGVVTYIFEICTPKWHTDISHKVHQGHTVPVSTYKVSRKSPCLLTELGKNTIVLRSYIAGIRKKKKNWSLWLGNLLIFEEPWLMCNTDTHCTGGWGL